MYNKIVKTKIKQIKDFKNISNPFPIRFQAMFGLHLQYRISKYVKIFKKKKMRN